jgi:hypothetical protein
LDIPDFYELQHMSVEEIAELNRRLAFKAFRRYALFMTVKWGLIFGVSYAARKYLESKGPYEHHSD